MSYAEIVATLLLVQTFTSQFLMLVGTIYNERCQSHHCLQKKVVV